MPAGTAGEDANVLEALPRLIVKRDVFKMNPVILERKTSQDRVLDGDRLLIDFFEHEMFVAAFFRHDRIPRDVLELRLANLTGSIEQTDAVALNNGDFMIVEEQDRSSVGKHRRNIRRNKSFTIDGPDN